MIPPNTTTGSSCEQALLFHIRRLGQKAVSPALTFVFAAALSGCGSLRNIAANSLTVSGTVSAGQQPITNAAVQIYATGTAGDGSAATPLLSRPAKTSETGSFTLANLQSCPSSSSEVFLVSTGGSPANLRKENSSASLMTLLGPCSSLASTSSIHLNEVTTIASVYSMAPYMSGPGAIGTSASDTQALLDAATFASELANLGTGTSPGSVPAGEAAPTDKLNTLANLVNSCVESAGGSAGDGSPCGNLFLTAGGNSASPARETVSAVLAIAKEPTVNVDSLYQLAEAGDVFEPVLSSAPVDWTLLLLQPPPQPVFSPAAGAYTSPQTVTLSDNDPAAILFYTTDGSTPSAASIRYSGVIPLSASATIRSIAIAGSLSSVVASSAYTITPPSAPPAPSAQRLAFVSGPTNSSAGTAFATAITVVAEDASGNPVTGNNVPVTLTIGSNPGAAVLQGATSANAGATAATFAGLSISQPGSGYTLVASSPGLNLATSPTFNVSATPGGQANVTYYVANSGSDSNPGSNASAPWKTIAKVNNAQLAPGTEVVFQSTSVWHEQLTAQAGVTYGPYGPAPSCALGAALVASCTNMPVIDGADVVTGWSQVGTSTFEAAYSGPLSKAFVDAIYSQTTPLTLVSNPVLVSATPSSVYADGKNVYVHLADDSNPANHTIEVSGARSYGVLVAGPGNVTVTGLEIIRTAKSGYLNYSIAGTGASNVVENSVFFNIGDSLPDVKMGGPIEGAILSVAGLLQAPVTGFLATNNWVGQMDVPHNTLNYSWAGIQVDGMAAAQVTKNKVATVNGWAIRVQDFFSNSCTAPVVSFNEMVNSEGNIGIAGCPDGVVENNSAHNSFGNGLEAGPGLRPTDLSTGLDVSNNDFEHLRPAYNNLLYNGIDINFVANGTAIGNHCLDVAFTCMTLEADNGASSGWTVTGNAFDASQNVYANGSAPNASIRVYPFYIRDTSLAGGLKMSQNTLTVNPASPYIKFGAASATDQTDDLTQQQFDIACPGCEVTSH